MKINALTAEQLSDLDYLTSLMDDVDDLPKQLAAVNEDGELVLANIHPEYISVRTHQSNGWYRTNVIHRDGTKEELSRQPRWVG